MVPSQGRTASELVSNLRAADLLFVWFARLACATLLVSVLVGCAEPVRIYHLGPVTFHEGDISPCERGAAACTIGMRDVYYLAGDEVSLQHEKEHLAGMTHGAWVTRGFEVCAVVTSQGGSSWQAGTFMCRQSNGSIVQRKAI